MIVWNFININEYEKISINFNNVHNALSGYAQEPVFAYDNNQIKAKPQFIEAFNNGNLTI